ncbi:MAG: hypothetical protein DRQ88_06990 [Epsilonproteobacteria bacterium]|nr:MAG: hypothetical protein DRQ89_12265 [Campylobacterota bacterium]RLA66302.1 MAG: hypothetical protein DRQ88_06990 [Campylobacterota bacterium]
MEIEKRKSQASSTLRVNADSIQEIFNLTGQLVLLKNQLLENEEIKSLSSQFLKTSLSDLDILIRTIEDRILSLRLTPIRSLFLKAHRIALETAKKINREIELHYEGEDTLIDREMIDILSDIFPHLIRNSLDHGIESPQERKKLGKSETGTISLRAEKIGNEVIISLTDDGRGINREKVINKAIKKGLLDSKLNPSTLPDSEVFSLLFKPGFSTSENITEISGRGVGLEVGKRVIEKLRGRIEIKNHPGQGLEFFIILPLNTTIMDALVVEINCIKYLIAINEVMEIVSLKDVTIKEVPNSKKFIFYQGVPIPLIEPKVLFTQELHPPIGKPREVGIIFNHGGRPMALKVDNIFNQLQIVLNPFDYDFITNNNFISGTAVLSNGQVSNLLDLQKMANYHLEKKV